MKKLAKEFKNFISRGNVLDMAVGVMIGGAITAIVNSLVNDLFMPLVSIFTQGFDFTKLSIVLGSGEHAATIMYGQFIAALINFFLIAIVLFSFIKLMNKIEKDLPIPIAEKEDEKPTTKTCPYCKSEINIEATRCPNCTSKLD